MNKQKVVSREYKIMLSPRRFTGDEQQIITKAGLFWSDFKQAIQPFIKDTIGELDAIVHRRAIRFYDTSNFQLRFNDYVFRERRDLQTGEREVTLKFRHPDRYISQDRNMDARKIDRGITKFEEDIKPPFLKLYSFSTKQKLKNDKELKKLDDLVLLFPDLVNKIDHYDKDEEITVVGDFSAHEIVISGAKFKIRNNPKLYSECALIVWYNNDETKNNPEVVEFSFNYRNKKESYTRKMSVRAFKIFQSLQVELKSWTSLKSKTKTAYIYSLAEAG